MIVWFSVWLNAILHIYENLRSIALNLLLHFFFFAEMYFIMLILPVKAKTRSAFNRLKYCYRNLLIKWKSVTQTKSFITCSTMIGRHFFGTTIVVVDNKVWWQWSIKTKVLKRQILGQQSQQWNHTNKFLCIIFLTTFHLPTEKILHKSSG